MIIPQIIYKMEYNKTKAKGYTLPYDTPHQQHMKKVKDITSNVSPAQTACTFKTFFKRGTGSQNMKSIFAFGGVFFIHLAAEVQRSVWEEQGPDQHGPWGSWDPCCQGGLQEHHQCKCLWWRYREISLSVQCWPKINLTYPLFFFLVSAWLQEEIWSHQEQVDLDSRQTRLPQCCQELLATEWCKLVLRLYCICKTFIFYFFIWTTSNIAALILLLLFCPQVEYKYDKEIMKGCVIPVVDDKLTLLAMKNAEMASTVSVSFF